MEKSNIKDNINIYFAIVVYVLFMFLFGALFIYICLYIGANIINLNGKDLIHYLNHESKLIKGTKEYNAFYTSYAIGQFITYLLLFIPCVFLMRNFLKEDFINFKNKYKYYIIYTIISIVIFLLVSFISSSITSHFVGESDNQELISKLLLSKAKIPMIIATLIFAPVCEELIFRKAIFEITKNLHKSMSYIISVSSFTLIHMLSSDMSNFGDWILLTIPYVLCAFLFCLIYDKSKKNIYTTIFVHIANNLLALIFLLI